jgi:uncharacterized protein (TIGR02145 family)
MNEMKKKNRILIYPLIAMGLLLTLNNSCKKVDDNLNPTDFDGNVYNTLTIGTQVWMDENLKVTHYRNGDAIPNVTDNTVWSGLTTGAYSDYDNSPGNSTTYGLLYNGYAVVDSRKLCPTGWHVPTVEEWDVLVNYLGGESAAGGKLKETDIIHWQSPNTGATNESGFTTLPSGYRESDGTFAGLGYYTDLWSSSGVNIDELYRRLITYDDVYVNNNGVPEVYGFSVRCLKD